ncbi:UDP-N-acetylmuramoyl-tripeptide--D-alanyl-D-alanine ligase [Candidatus Parcubacteria bacterium]|nr:UDP-N-acetylmuramoyl-tripeptide--D-alanyl-D-alanine ligase [Candidatus Parcubacteria bacterium]
MGSELRLAIILVWIPQAIRQALVWTYWWQVKEYRPDRFRILLTSPDGRRKLQLGTVAVKLLLLLSSICVHNLFWVATAAFLILDLKFLLEIARHQARKPVFTKRGQKIFATSLIFILLTVAGFLPLLFGEVSLLLTPYLGILWTIPIVNKVKKEEIQKAHRKLQAVKPIVVGITGSYGKTTTKEFIAHLLSQKYEAAKTTGSENTEFGIARKTAKYVQKDTKFFIVEMGAYKKGEIRLLTQIVNPQVGIITGIEEQHLALFGSLENIMDAKFELISALPDEGTAIFNFSNPHCRELAQRARKIKPRLKVLSYAVAPTPADLTAKIVSAQVNGIDFEVTEDKTATKLFAPVRGVHFIENLTGAILIARTFGVSWKQIAEGCRTLPATDRALLPFKLKTGTIIIDDSYNTTPKGFAAALEYLNLFKEQKKVVVTPGIIELGKLSQSTHHQLGKLMANRVDRVLLTSPEFARNIQTGLGKRSAVLEVLDNPKRLTRRFSELLGADSVILLEGRMPQSLIDMIGKHKND